MTDRLLRLLIEEIDTADPKLERCDLCHYEKGLREVLVTSKFGLRPARCSHRADDPAGPNRIHQRDPWLPFFDHL